MHYTLLFTDSKGRTQGIIVVKLDDEEQFPDIVKHSHDGNDYARAYLLDAENGFSKEPLYVRQGEQDRGHEVDCALAALMEELDAVPA